MSVNFNFNYDNKDEQKQGSAKADLLSVPAVHREVKISLGYSNKNCLEVTINSVSDLKTATYDAVAICENRRLQPLNEAQKLYDLTPDEEHQIEELKKTGVKFHKIEWPPVIREKFAQWGRIKKEKRNRPMFNIVLVRSKLDRVFIRTADHEKTGNWYWGGWENPLNINFDDLYMCILKTEEHCRQLEKFIDGVCDNL
jgi:hypothetical protein